MLLIRESTPNEKWTFPNGFVQNEQILESAVLDLIREKAQVGLEIGPIVSNLNHEQVPTIYCLFRAFEQVEDTVALDSEVMWLTITQARFQLTDINEKQALDDAYRLYIEYWGQT